MGKPLSWKWKLAVGGIIFAFVCMFIIFTPWGCDIMKGWIDSAYNETPAVLRKDQEAADYHMMLAGWQAICGRDDVAINMYLELIGLQEGKPGVWPRDPNPRWKSKGKKCWGYQHPRAPEAYRNLLVIYEQTHTSRRTGEWALRYHNTFYRYCISKNGRPHPNFYKYWQHISNLIQKAHLPMPPVAVETAFRRPFKYKQEKDCK